MSCGNGSGSRLKKPRLENEPPIEDDVAYTVSGAVENVYASLVVLLGYTNNVHAHEPVAHTRALRGRGRSGV